MTNQNINFFCLVLVSGCMTLLFTRSVYTYPHDQFEFSKPFEHSESNHDESMQPAIETTTTTTFNREKQLPISNANHMQGHGTSLRSRTPGDDISTSFDGTYQNGAQTGERRLYEQHQNVVTTTMQIDAKFVFPTDDIPTLQSHKTPIGPAPVCHGSTFCERASYYPEEIINNAIQQNDTLKYYATEDVIPDIVERIDATNESPLCVSREQVVYPQSGECKDKGWLYIVNQENFKQGVRIETCVNENHDCDIVNNLPDGYKSICKQKFIYRQLVAITTNNEVAPELFPFPSSCCCHLKLTGNVMTRLGINVNQRSQTTPVKNRKQ